MAIGDVPTDEGPSKLLLADANKLVIAGIQRLADADPRLTVAASCRDGETFVRLAQEIPASVGVIGWDLPVLNAREVLRRLRDVPGTPPLVVHAGSSEAAVARQVLALGGAGFCGKDESPERMLDIAARVAAGWMVFPSVDVRRLEADPLERLTVRERHLLRGLADGASNPDLARWLGVSLNTIKFHLKNLYDKLDVRNRAGAVAVYMAHADDR